jgi:hypothetical protein
MQHFSSVSNVIDIWYNYEKTRIQTIFVEVMEKQAVLWGEELPFHLRPKQGRHDFLPVSVREDVSGITMLCGKPVPNYRVPDISSGVFSIVGG